MQTDLHPDYTLLTVKLADGTEFVTRSTMDKERLNSEVDSSNHPFYTGKRTMVDTAGRVEKFRQRYGDAQAKQIAADEAEQAAADKAKAESEGVEAEGAEA